MTAYYEPPEGDLSGTVFDPTDHTFGPIMAALQSGDFALAQRLICDLLDDYTELDLFELVETYLATKDSLRRIGSDLVAKVGYDGAPDEFVDGMARLLASPT